MGLRKKRILIVEDDRDQRLALGENLSRRGFDCIEVENGVAAIAYVEIGAVDLVITDFQMPIMDGIELAAWIKTEQKQKVPPVILLTGETHTDMNEIAKKNGVSSMLAKPYNFRDLMQLIEKSLA